MKTKSQKNSLRRSPRSLAMRIVFPVGSILVTGLLIFSTSHSAPIPWTVSNLNPEGESSYVLGPDGELLTGEFRVHLIQDVEGDGADDPEEEHGFPTDDDVLIASWVSSPGPGVLPDGSFEFYSSEDSDALANLTAYIRAFEDVDPHDDLQAQFVANADEHLLGECLQGLPIDQDLGHSAPFDSASRRWQPCSSGGMTQRIVPRSKYCANNWPQAVSSRQRSYTCFSLNGQRK